MTQSRTVQPPVLVRQIQRLADIRRWEDAHLPIYGSLLGHDLLLLLAQFYVEGRRFTLKEVYFSLPYSENAIRLHLKRLVRDGWLLIDNGGLDRRCRFAAPSDKLTRVLERYVLEARYPGMWAEMPPKVAGNPVQNPLEFAVDLVTPETGQGARMEKRANTGSNVVPLQGLPRRAKPGLAT